MSLFGSSPLLGCDWGGGGGILAGLFSPSGLERIVSMFSASSALVPLGCVVPHAPQKRDCGGSSAWHDMHLLMILLSPSG